MRHQIRPIGRNRCLLGEGAYWSQREQCLYWVDIKRHHIYRYNPETETERQWTTPDTIGFVADNPHGEGLIGALRKGLAKIDLPETGTEAQVTYIATLERDLPDNRFNDGNVDQFGNIWAGSMDDKEEQVSGSWWHIDAGGEARRLMRDFKVTNGPAFSPDGDHVYLTDSAKQEIYKARYDRRGALSDYRLWKAFGDGDGYPDGMNFDANGRLWIAFWDGNCVRSYDESGEMAEIVELPVERPTKPVFSPDGTGYVTSASVGLENTDGDSDWNGMVLEFTRQSESLS